MDTCRFEVAVAAWADEILQYEKATVAKLSDDANIAIMINKTDEGTIARASLSDHSSMDNMFRCQRGGHALLQVEPDLQHSSRRHSNLQLLTKDKASGQEKTASKTVMFIRKGS